MADLEAATIRRVLETNTILPLVDRGIVEDDFAGSLTKKMFIFIIETKKEYGKVPDISTIEQKFGYKFDDAPETLEFYADELLRKTQCNLLATNLANVTDKIKTRDAAGAIEIARNAVSIASSRTKARKGEVVNSAATGANRIKEYEALKLLPDVVDGIRSPWPLLDKITLGWHKGELIVWLGITNVGKTYILLANAIAANKHKKKVLFISPEMSRARIEKRLDCMLAGLPFDDFRKRLLTEDQEKIYKKAMEEFKDGPDFIIAASGAVKNTNDIEALVEKHRPDLVAVDSFYKIRGHNNSAAHWERVSEVSDFLKDLKEDAQIAIMTTSQFTKKVKAGEKDTSFREAGFAYNIVQDADIVLSASQDEDMRALKQMYIKLLKGRDSEVNLDFLINWDFLQMDFTEIMQFGTNGPQAVTIGEEQY